MGDGEALLCFSKSPRRCRRGLRNEFLSSQNVSAFTLPITTLKKKKSLPKTQGDHILPALVCPLHEPCLQTWFFFYI